MVPIAWHLLARIVPSFVVFLHFLGIKFAIISKKPYVFYVPMLAQFVPKAAGIGDKQMNTQEKIDRSRERRETEQQIREHIERIGGKAALVAYERATNQVAREQSSEEQREKNSRQNRGFTQVYEEGWNRLESLMKSDANAARIYAFLAKNCGPDGTLCVSRQTLAEALEIGERTVSRHIKTLEKEAAIIVLKVGTANVYALNPAEVWKSFGNAKPFAAFNTRTLVGKTENPFVKRRLATLLNGQKPEQTDMFSSVEWPEPEPDTSELDDIMSATQEAAE